MAKSKFREVLLKNPTGNSRFKRSGKEVVFTRSVRKDTLDTYTRASYKGPIAALEEIALSNPFDADASEVHIQIDFEKDYIRIKDNGTGMKRDDPDADLNAFFWAGESPKKRKPISPGGRERVGDYGIAAKQLSCMCHNLELVTMKDGVRTYVSEGFEKGVPLMIGKKIPARETQVSKKLHGTEILLHGLKFQKRGFSMQHLTTRIQNNFEINPGFRVYVNGEEISPFSVDTATRYIFDQTGEDMGRVTGEIYYSHKPTPKAGFYLRIKKRTRGDPKKLLEEISDNVAMRRRAVIRVNAEKLVDALLFDKGEISDEHVGIVELKARLKTELTRIRQDQSGMTRKKRKEYVSLQKERLAKNALEPLIRAEIIPRTIGLRLEEQTSGIGSYGPQKGFVLNANYPGFEVTSKTTPAKFQTIVQLALVDLLSLYESKDLIGFLGERQKLLGIIQGQIEASVRELDRTSPINQFRFYNPNELTGLNGRSIKTIMGLMESKFLDSTPEGVLGEEYEKTEKRIKGLIGIYDMAVEKCASGTVTWLNERAHEILRTVRTEVHQPFVYNLGSRNNPCYFVESICVDDVYDILRTGYSRGTDEDAPTRAFKELANCYFTFTELISESHGRVSNGKVQITLTEARKADIPIDSKKVKPASGDKTRNAYRYADFVRAMQLLRGPDTVAHYKM